MGLAKITVLTWDRFNEKRSDVKNPSWLRLDNDFPQSQSMFGLRATERYVFVTLLCLCSRKQRADHEIDVGWFCYYSGNAFDELEAIAAFENLAARGCITFEPVRAEAAGDTDGARNVPGTPTEGARPCAGVTNERTNERTDDKLKGDASASPPPGQLALVPETPNSTALVPAAKPPGRYAGKPEAEREFVATYVRAYRGRYGPGLRPECLDDGKTIGLVRSFLKSRPLERACDLVQVYLQMDDRRFVDAKHDIVTFTQRINQIGLALHDGRDPSKPLTFAEYMQRKEAMNEVVCRGPVGLQRTD